MPNDTVSALRAFIAARLHEDLNTALSAGHGYGHQPHGTFQGEAEQPEWTRLDYTDNSRPSYDLRFASRFTPGWVVGDIERKLELATTSDEPALRVLASQWAAHKNFDPAWARTPRNGRQLAEELDALATSRS